MELVMKIRFRCLPELEPHLPPPVLARTGLPTWVKAMPGMAESELLAAPVRTVKHCPPFLDAMQHGILMPLAADVEVRDRTFHWDWDVPILKESRLTRSPIGVHLPDQLNGVPFGRADRFAVKFNNFWSIELPDGWSMLFMHPLNREDLPFRTLAGRVDCDKFQGGFVHFPALWVDDGFEGVLRKGTPVAQAVPVPRAAIKLDIAALDGDGLARHLDVQDTLERAPGAYRRRYRFG